MPINKDMMKSLVKEYGKKKGTTIYYAIEQKYRVKHNLPLLRRGHHIKNKKK